MKVLSTLVICSGLTLATAVFGQFGPQVPEWQSVKIVQTVDPVFPFPLTQQGLTRGEARVAVNTDAKGRLVEWLVVGYTRTEFANEAVDVIKKWAFVPARMRGEPVGTTIEIYFISKPGGWSFPPPRSMSWNGQRCLRPAVTYTSLAPFANWTGFPHR